MGLFIGCEYGRELAAAFEEYDEMFGSPRKAQQVDPITGKLYEFTIRGMRGPRDRVQPKTGEEQMEPERLPQAPRVRSGVVCGATQRLAAEIVAVLRSAGRGMTPPEIAQAIGGYSLGRVEYFLSERRRRYGIEGKRQGRYFYYSLIGEASHANQES